MRFFIFYFFNFLPLICESQIIPKFSKINYIDQITAVFVVFPYIFSFSFCLIVGFVSLHLYGNGFTRTDKIRTSRHKIMSNMSDTIATHRRRQFVRTMCIVHVQLLCCFPAYSRECAYRNRRAVICIEVSVKAHDL